MTEQEIKKHLLDIESGTNFESNFNPGIMTPRERFNNWMHFKDVDRIPNEEFGYWNETFPRWHREGMPEYVSDNDAADIFFQFDRRDFVPVTSFHFPMFEVQTLEETEEYKIVVDDWGIKCKIFTDGDSTIPHYIDFPIKNRDDFKAFKNRLDPLTEGRFPENWNKLVENWKHRDYPLGANIGSLFGWLRNWMGFEGISYAVYDDPGLVLDMMDTVTELLVVLTKKIVSEVELDFVQFWEDMAFKNGPMISPKMFNEFMVPRYKKITSVFIDHGVDVIYVDCDGNINELVDLWMKAGIPGMFPLEIGCESDPVKLREKYGEQVLLLGGVDKKELAKGKSDIDRELSRLEKTLKTGGFIPHVDHRCPPDVSYENYLYYLEQKKKMLEIV